MIAVLLRAMFVRIANGRVNDHLQWSVPVSSTELPALLLLIIILIKLHSPDTVPVGVSGKDVSGECQYDIC